MLDESRDRRWHQPSIFGAHLYQWTASKASVLSLAKMVTGLLLWFASFTCFLLPVMAFTANLPYRYDASLSFKNTQTILGMAPLSNEEIFARAAEQKASALEEDAQPMLFDDLMLKDMQTALLIMEKRATEGPGSLFLPEVDQLDVLLQKILLEMRQNQHLKPQRPTRSPQPSIASTSGTSATTNRNMEAPSRRTAETWQSAPNVIDIDTPDDDDESFGSAGETTNTYIIPGMEQMTAAEYQYELQKAVIEKQNMRRRSQTTGNRSSWDYMNQLTGEKGVLKKESPKPKL
jgi:hypothetical protein